MNIEELIDKSGLPFDPQRLLVGLDDEAIHRITINLLTMCGEEIAAQENYNNKLCEDLLKARIKLADAEEMHKEQRRLAELGDVRATRDEAIIEDLGDRLAKMTEKCEKAAGHLVEVHDDSLETLIDHPDPHSWELLLGSGYTILDFEEDSKADIMKTLRVNVFDSHVSLKLIKQAVEAHLEWLALDRELAFTRSDKTPTATATFHLHSGHRDHPGQT